MKRTLLKWTTTTLMVLGLALAHASPAWAGPATDLVKAKQTAMFELLRGGGNEAKLQAIFDEMLDYGALAAASLGPEWAGRSEQERAEFTDLLKQLVRRAWESNLKKTLDFTIDYVNEDAKEGGAVVTTKATSKKDARDEPVEIAFKLGEKDGRLRVQDIVTEGVSLVSSYRSQFTKIIKKDGFAALTKKMKDKVAKGDVR